MDAEKDYIEITMEDGTQVQAELVMKFKLENLGEYVIYKIEDVYYGARYEIDGENTKLIVDLTEEEQSALNRVFIEMGD